jgi:hypothetical protein
MEVALQRKPINALEIDMAAGNGGDVRQDRIAGNGLTGLFTPLEYLIQFPGVVGYHGVGEQRQCAADHDFLVPPAPAIEANGTGVNDTLKLVDGFTEAAMKLIWLQLREITQKWRMAPREWSAAKAQFAVVLGDRFEVNR